MVISCPACHTKYNINPQGLGPMGRVVRCVRCKHQWHQQPAEGAQPVQQPPVPPRPADYDYRPNLPAVQKNQSGDGWYLPAAVLLFTLLGGGIWLFKDHVQHAFPNLQQALNPLQNAHEIKTLDVRDTASTMGLVIGNISREIEEQDGFVTYIVRGTITNTNNAEKRVPNLRVALLDNNGRQLDAWRVQPERRILDAGSETNWVCLFYDPPLGDINEFDIKFVTE